MAALKAQGRVVETRPGILVIRENVAPQETTFEVKETDVLPGGWVWIYDDGMVEATPPASPPPGVTEHVAPQKPAEAEPGDHDHS